MTVSARGGEFQTRPGMYADGHLKSGRRRYPQLDNGAVFRFFSHNRAYIINLEHITALDAANVPMFTDRRLPAAGASLAALKKAYMGICSLGAAVLMFSQI